MARKKYKKAFTLIVLVLVSIFFAFPFIWLVIQSLQTNEQLITSPPRILPNVDPFINYKAIFLGELYGMYEVMVPTQIFWIPRSILNSCIVSICSTIVCLFIAAPAAYTFATVRFRGRDNVMFLTILTRTLPVAAVILPLFLMMKHFRLIDTYGSLIMIYVGALAPYTIWMLTSYFQTIPMDLIDAARIDGSSRLQTLTKIVLPLSLPGLATAFLFNFLLSWNEFFVALIMTKSPNTYTLPVVISMFATLPQMIPYSLMIASAVSAALPPVIITLIFQKYIVSGLLMGAVKG